MMRLLYVAGAFFPSKRVGERVGERAESMHKNKLTQIYHLTLVMQARASFTSKEYLGPGKDSGLVKKSGERCTNLTVAAEVQVWIFRHCTRLQ